MRHIATMNGRPLTFKGKSCKSLSDTNTFLWTETELLYKLSRGETTLDLVFSRVDLMFSIAFSVSPLNTMWYSISRPDTSVQTLCVVSGVTTFCCDCRCCPSEICPPAFRHLKSSIVVTIQRLVLPKSLQHLRVSTSLITSAFAVPALTFRWTRKHSQVIITTPFLACYSVLCDSGCST